MSIHARPAMLVWCLGVLVAFAYGCASTSSGPAALRRCRCVAGKGGWSADCLPDLAAELVLMKSGVIVAPGAAAAVTARLTKTIPIIMFAAGDPVASRIVASLARPGANVTGLATISSALSGKRLQLLRAAIPNAKRIAVLVNRANPSHPVALILSRSARSATEQRLPS